MTGCLFLYFMYGQPIHESLIEICRISSVNLVLIENTFGLIPMLPYVVTRLMGGPCIHGAETLSRFGTYFDCYICLL